MKVLASEHGELILEEIYNPIILRTNSGEELSICMRDSGFEAKYYGDTQPVGIILQNGKVESTLI